MGQKKRFPPPDPYCMLYLPRRKPKLWVTESHDGKLTMTYSFFRDAFCILCLSFLFDHPAQSLKLDAQSKELDKLRNITEKGDCSHHPLPTAPGPLNIQKECGDNENGKLCGSGSEFNHACGTKWSACYTTVVQYNRDVTAFRKFIDKCQSQHHTGSILGP